MNLIIGSHVTFNRITQLVGSVDDALSHGENTFMFYTGAPQNTIRVKINDELTKQGIEKAIKNNIDYSNVVVHAPYIINLANSDKEKHEFAIEFLKEEVKRCKQLKIKKLVLHPGSHMGLGINVGIKNIVDGLNNVLEECDDITILLETMAGKGNECGKNFEELKQIIDGITKKYNIGVCLDTCHLNDAGYNIGDFDSVLDEFDKIIGIDKIGCVHINDSKNVIASHKDRHENIGFGTIGFDNIINIIYNERLDGIPKILETPYISNEDDSKEKLYAPYKFEIEMIKDKKFNKNLLNDIRQYYKK